MKIKTVFEIEIIAEEKLRQVHSVLVKDDKYDSELEGIANIVGELILNLDKLPDTIRDECNQDGQLTCLGINLTDSWSSVNRSELDYIDYD